MRDSGPGGRFVTIPPMPRGSRAAGVGAIVAVLLLATACAKGATSSAPVATLSTTTPPTFTPSSAASLRPSATAMSAEVPTSAPTGDKSDAAAIQTARAYVWATNRASVTQNIHLLDALADPSCPCVGGVQSAIEKQRRDHVRLESDPLVDVTAAVLDRGASAITVHVSVTVPADRILNSRGIVIERDAASRVDSTMTLRFDGNRWRVARNDVK
jgi:hypothetical protein